MGVVGKKEESRCTKTHTNLVLNVHSSKVEIPINNCVACEEERLDLTSDDYFKTYYTVFVCLKAHEAESCLDCDVLEWRKNVNCDTCPLVCKEEERSDRRNVVFKRIGCVPKGGSCEEVCV